jgi:fucose permease
MSIVGGAILPAVMGWVSDQSSIQTAFAVPLGCYAYVLYFAMRGHVPRGAGVDSGATASRRDHSSTPLSR